MDDAANFTPPEQAEFDRIKKLVLQVVPEAEQTISYGMPTFKHRGKVLLHVGRFRDHMSMFPGAEPIAKLADKLKSYKTAKGTVQFTLEKPLPDALLKEIIATCKERCER